MLAETIWETLECNLGDTLSAESDLEARRSDARWQLVLNTDVLLNVLWASVTIHSIHWAQNKLAFVLFTGLAALGCHGMCFHATTWPWWQVMQIISWGIKIIWFPWSIRAINHDALQMAGFGLKLGCAHSFWRILDCNCCVFASKLDLKVVNWTSETKTYNNTYGECIRELQGDNILV